VQGHACVEPLLRFSFAAAVIARQGAKITSVPAVEVGAMAVDTLYWCRIRAYGGAGRFGFMVRRGRSIWCNISAMTRISVDVNDEWLDAARAVLGTETKVATINEALRSFAVRKQARDLLDALDSVQLDVSGSGDAWRYGGGRDLSQLAERAREERSA
jgi:hypothetical protein